MRERRGPLDWLKEKLFIAKDGQEDEVKKKPNLFHYVILVAVVGIGFMLLQDLISPKTAVPVEGQPEETSKAPVETFSSKEEKGSIPTSDFEAYYEDQLTDALQDVTGIGEVKVVVNVDASEKIVYEKNKSHQTQVTKETDKQGGNRTIEDKTTDEQIVIIRNGESEQPIVIETKMPKIRGVLVVAEGADNIQVKKWIIESVTSALDVPIHRVAVMPKKSKGDES